MSQINAGYQAGGVVDDMSTRIPDTVYFPVNTMLKRRKFYTVTLNFTGAYTHLLEVDAALAHHAKLECKGGALISQSHLQTSGSFTYI